MTYPRDAALCADIVSTLVDSDVSEEEFRRLEPYTMGQLHSAIEQHLEREAERRAEAEQCGDGPLDPDVVMDCGVLYHRETGPR